jgi:hypothetical protein
MEKFLSYFSLEQYTKSSKTCSLTYSFDLGVNLLQIKYLLLKLN